MPLKLVSIIGIGYVGLCTAVGFASKGFKVIASTHNHEKHDMINKGVPPFYEPDLEKWLRKVVRKGFLRCVLNQTNEAVLETDISFNTVGTPSLPNGSIDLQHIKRSTREGGKAFDKKDAYHLVVVKSTVVSGTPENVVKPILENHSGKRCGPDFGLCMSPEFLREGSALRDTMYPDRTIIGEYDKKSGDVLEGLYRDFYGDKTPPTIKTNLPTAELIKYTSNAVLATKISFINIIANICEKIPGADVTAVAKGVGLDKRISPLFLNAGLGYGGSCFPKDVKALIAFSRSMDYDPLLLNAVENVNKVQPYKAVMLSRKLLGNLQDKRIAVLGLAFKPNTDDMREAVSIKIIRKLLQERADVTAYDPSAMINAKMIFGNRIKYASSSIECIKGADCCIIVTEWDEFKKLQPKDFIQNMRQPILIDGRRIYNPKQFSQKLKFTAIGLG